MHVLTSGLSKLEIPLCQQVIHLPKPLSIT